MAKEDTTRSVQLPCRAAATTPRGTATDTEISRVRIITDRVGRMRSAIIETIDCPENKEFPRSPCNAAKAQVPKRIAPPGQHRSGAGVGAGQRMDRPRQAKPG